MKKERGERIEMGNLASLEHTEWNKYTDTFAVQRLAWQIVDGKLIHGDSINLPKKIR